MDAIIRSLTSGEHFLAELDDSGDAVALSVALPVYEATDRDTGETRWADFAYADTEPIAPWEADRFAVVHQFEVE